MKENEINIKDDFFTFRNKLIEKKGEFYAEQSDLFFERAVYFAERGFPLSAISDAKFAYSLAQYQPENYRIIYLIGFLCQIHLDNDFIKKAKAYCDLGFQLLDEESPDYEDDYKAFSELRDIIKGEDWKTNFVNVK